MKYELFNISRRKTQKTGQTFKCANEHPVLLITVLFQEISLFLMRKNLGFDPSDAWTSSVWFCDSFFQYKLQIQLQIQNTKLGGMNWIMTCCMLKEKISSGCYHYNNMTLKTTQKVWQMSGMAFISLRFEKVVSRPPWFDIFDLLKFN